MFERSKCETGKFSRDGKGSFINPCLACPDPKSNYLGIAKGLPIGTYQCPIGNFDKTNKKGVDMLVNSYIPSYSYGLGGLPANKLANLPDGSSDTLLQFIGQVTEAEDSTALLDLWSTGEGFCYRRFGN